MSPPTSSLINVPYSTETASLTVQQNGGKKPGKDGLLDGKNGKILEKEEKEGLKDGKAGEKKKVDKKEKKKREKSADRSSIKKSNLSLEKIKNTFQKKVKYIIYIS